MIGSVDSHNRRGSELGSPNQHWFSLGSDLDRVRSLPAYFLKYLIQILKMHFSFFFAIPSRPVRLLFAETIQGSISSLVSWLELKMW